jgi:hypothetical protein
VTTDAKIQDVAVRYIRDNAIGGRALLPFESLGTLQPALTDHCSLQDGELVLVSAFFSSRSWYVFTTRRIVSLFGEELESLDPSQGVEAVFPNCKGYAPGDKGEVLEPGIIPRDIATIRAITSRVLIHFEYQTCQGSGPPMWAVRYWENKHPFRERLMTKAELEHYRRHIATPGKPGGIPEMPPKEQARQMVKLHARGVTSTSDVWHRLLRRASSETMPVFLSEFTPEIHDYFRQVALPKYGALLEALTDWYGSNER